MKRKSFIKKWQTPLIIVALVSLIIGGLAGTITGFYAANLIANNDTPFLYSLLYQKLLRPLESVNQGAEQIKEIIERKQVVKQIIESESSVVEVVENVSPSVVSIVVSKYVSQYYGSNWESPFDDFFNDPFNWPFGFQFELEPSIPAPQQEQKEKQQVGGGTGFVISSKEGLILTNKHVVSEQDAEYTVISNDGQKYEAEVLARDPFNDIAVLKIISPDFDLPEVTLGDSDNIKIGQTAIAIGNSLGEYRNTVTKGVISGISRRVIASDATGRSELLEDVIQTDAAINFGNSGGPLINLLGEVIGINTAINRAGQLIGFAIPINQAKQVIESVKQYGRIIRPFLGVRYILINEWVAEEKDLSVDYGALIVKGSQENEPAIIPESPASKVGLIEDDIILKVNGREINEQHSLVKEIQGHKPGDEVKLKILRQGEEKIVTAVLEEYKE